MIIQQFKESYINPLSLQGIIYVVVKDFQPNMRGFYCDDETIKHPITMDEDDHLDMETVNQASFLAVFRKFNFGKTMSFSWISFRVSKNPQVFPASPNVFYEGILYLEVESHL